MLKAAGRAFVSKEALAYGAVLIVLGVVFACADLRVWRPWIELINGATWPNEVVHPTEVGGSAKSQGALYDDHKAFVVLAVTARTGLSVGVVLVAVALFIHLHASRGRAMAAVSVVKMLRARDHAIARVVAREVARNPRLASEGGLRAVVDEAVARYEHDELEPAIGAAAMEAFRSLQVDVPAREPV